MQLQERINHLQGAAGVGSQLEQYLLYEGVLTISPNGTPHAGKSGTHVVMLDSRRRAIFKSFAGQNRTTCSLYRQDPFEAVVHEVVAWRLAHALGGHWEQLVPTAVLRDVTDLGGGALINWRDGSPNMDVLVDAKAQVHAAAFWDALIGQQDRHANNFRYDAESKRLALIDNAFAFARPRDFLNGSLFLAYRRSTHESSLTGGERDALGTLLDADDLLGLRKFLDGARAEALEARATQMLERNTLPLPGAF